MLRKKVFYFYVVILLSFLKAKKPFQKHCHNRAYPHKKHVRWIGRFLLIYKALRRVFVPFIFFLNIYSIYNNIKSSDVISDADTPPGSNLPSHYIYAMMFIKAFVIHNHGG